MNYVHQPQAVLYTRDMHPITVVELSAYAWDVLWSMGRLSVAIREPLRAIGFVPPGGMLYSPRRVEIIGERFRYRGSEVLMLFTADEENALLLKSVFLPGQRRSVHDERIDAFGRGFLEALKLASQ